MRILTMVLVGSGDIAGVSRGQGRREHRPVGRRSLGPLVAATLALLLVGSCGLVGRSNRRPTPLSDGRLGSDGRTLQLGVSSCTGEPSASVLEADDRVVITAEAYQDNTLTCLDGIVVTLSAPLGDRPVVDGVTGEVVRITRLLY